LLQGNRVRLLWAMQRDDLYMGRPPYALNRNPIERLCNIMHIWFTHDQLFATFNQYTEANLGFFRMVLLESWIDFRDTISDNFWLISFNE
jgi:hypothetical protein